MFSKVNRSQAKAWSYSYKAEFGAQNSNLPGATQVGLVRVAAPFRVTVTPENTL